MKIKHFLITSLSLSLLSACSDMQTSTSTNTGTTAPAQSSATLPSYAATECGRNFTTSGDPRNGATFTTFVKLQGLDVRSAIGQVEKIAIDQGIQVGADQIDGGFGKVTMVVKDPSGGHDYPLVAIAQKTTGRVALVAKLNQGQIFNNDQVRDHMCDMLSKVRMDAAGASAAAATQQKIGSGKITDIKALDLAQEVASALKQKQDAADVTMKYAGRVFRIDGQVSRPTDGMSLVGDMQIANVTKSFSIPYITEVHGGLLGIGPMVQTPVQIMCRTAPDQFSRFAVLRNRDYATLIATVVGFNGKGRPKSMFVDNPMTTNGSVFSDQSYGGILNVDCRYEK
jgi:hypothetical protein